MKKRTLYIPALVLLLFFSTLSFSGCKCAASAKSTVKTLEVIKDTAMLQRLFPEGKWGLTAADAAISIPLSGDRSLWLWGDSFVGKITPGMKEPDTRMIMGNVFLVLDRDGAHTIIGGNADNPQAVVRCDSVDGKLAVYWTHHGFAENGILHWFASRIVFGGTGMWDFHADEVRYFRLDTGNFQVIDSYRLDAFETNGVGYGFGLHKHKGYYYLYGNKGEGRGRPASLHAARARLVNDKLQDFEYFDGSGWSADPSLSAALEGVDVSVSSQFSVFNHKGKFILINQEKGIGMNDIYSFISDSPVGPWKNKKKLYSVPETLQDSNLFAYNAMAHPQYSSDDHLLVSYCLNTHTPMERNSDYRPRFILVPYDMILK